MNKLARRESKRMIGGVCAGIGSYININPNLIRLAFILLIFASFSGPILYLALMILMPTESKLDAPPSQWIQANIEELGETASQTISRIGDHPRGTVIAGTILIVVGISILTGDIGKYIWLAALGFAGIYYLRSKK